MVITGHYICCRYCPLRWLPWRRCRPSCPLPCSAWWRQSAAASLCCCRRRTGPSCQTRRSRARRWGWCRPAGSVTALTGRDTGSDLRLGDLKCQVSSNRFRSSFSFWPQAYTTETDNLLIFFHLTSQKYNKRLNPLLYFSTWLIVDCIFSPWKFWEH